MFNNMRRSRNTKEVVIGGILCITLLPWRFGRVWEKELFSQTRMLIMKIYFRIFFFFWESKTRNEKPKKVLKVEHEVAKWKSLFQWFLKVGKLVERRKTFRTYCQRKGPVSAFNLLSKHTQSLTARKFDNFIWPLLCLADGIFRLDYQIEKAATFPFFQLLGNNFGVCVKSAVSGSRQRHYHRPLFLSLNKFTSRY